MFGLDMLAGLVGTVLRVKSSQEIAEERNVVYYPRVHSFARKYVYGERPEDPLTARGYAEQNSAGLNE